MRGRFTTSIASTDGWSYGPGTEVLVAGDQYTEDAVPERVGQQWLASGVLEPVATRVESAQSRAPELAAVPTNTHPRRDQRGAPRR
jgi:hypothetical protein